MGVMLELRAGHGAARRSFAEPRQSSVVRKHLKMDCGGKSARKGRQPRICNTDLQSIFQELSENVIFFYPAPAFGKTHC